MNRRRVLGLIAASAVTVAATGCSPSPSEAPSPSASTAPSTRVPGSPSPSPSAPESTDAGKGDTGRSASRDEIEERYDEATAGEFGLAVPGVQLSLPAGCAASALTLDACGGPSGSGVDEHLLDALRELGVPATLFINRRWAQANPATMAKLVEEPLWEIQNHGTEHRPLSVTGKSAYGVKGTASAGEVYDEVMDNQNFLRAEYGLECSFVRSGTAHLDEASAEICQDLGLTPVNFTVNLDDGAALPADQVAARTAELTTGDIALGHFNQPASGTGQGLPQTLPWLLEQGLRFVTLEQVC